MKRNQDNKMKTIVTMPSTSRKIHTLITIVMTMVLISSSIVVGISTSLVKTAATNEKTAPTEPVKNDLLTYSYQFSVPKPITQEEGMILSIDGLDMLTSPGKPILPMKTFKLLLPCNTELGHIEVIPGPVQVLPMTFTIAPAQQPIPLIETEKSTRTEPDPSVYNSAEKYPGKLYEIVSLQHKHEYSILIINMFPLQYSPTQDKVYFYPSLDVKIAVTPRNKDMEKTFIGRQSSEIIREIQDFVDNPEVVSTYVQGSFADKREKTDRSLVDPSETYQYVIITNEALRDATGEFTFQDLIQSKINKGLTATIVTVEDIEACPAYWWNGVFGDGDPLFNDTACHIRNFIKDAYQNWETTYILLGGDGDGADVGGESGDAIVPARGFYDPVFKDWTFTIASDMYYSCLHGSFDADLDGVFGEPGDGSDIDPVNGEVDLMSEVFVGRAPVDNEVELSNFIRKTLAYESSQSDYLKNVLMVGEYLGFGGIAEYGGNYKDEIKDGSDNYGYITAGIPSMYNVTTLYDRDWPNHDWPKEELKTRINAGIHIINHLGHGNNFHLMKLDEPVTMRGGEIQGPCHDVMDLTNDQYCFVYSQACHSGSFDNRDDYNYGKGRYLPFDSIAEYFVTAPHGAFACIANTRYGWGTGYSTNGPSQHFDREFFDALFGENKRELGQANQDSKEDNIGYIMESSAFSLYIRYCYYEITLFGDPEVAVKPDHNVAVQSIDTPTHVAPSESVNLVTTIMNNGNYNETNVLVSFRIDGIEVGMVTIPSFERLTTQQVSFLWVLSALGVYTLTVNVTIWSGVEDFSFDNEQSQTLIIGIYNSDTGECFDTIQHALDDQNTTNGHHILVPPGRYLENVLITKAIEMRGVEKTTTILDGCGGVIFLVQDISGVNITDFTIMNGSCGVYFSSADDSHIVNNNIVGSSLGIYLNGDSNVNHIYHNDLNNTENAVDDGSGNYWNNTYTGESFFRLAGGNWWSDYSGEDLCKGPEQNLNGSDGIIDEPYHIMGEGDAWDHYPLKDPAGSIVATIYVDDDNTDGPWWGTSDHPFRYVQDAVNVSQDGETVFVKNGTYNAHVVIEASIQFIGEDTQTTILDGGEAGTAVTINVDNVTVSGFTIQHCGLSQLALAVNANHITITGNLFLDNFRSIWLSSSLHTIISSNEIHTGDYGNYFTMGIQLDGVSDSMITQNTILGGRVGIEIIQSHDNTIMQNIVTQNGNGIVLDYLSHNNMVTQNIAVSNFFSGITIAYHAENNTVMKNLLIYNRDYGLYIPVDLANALGAYNNNIYQNDFYFNGVNAEDSCSNKWYNATIQEGNYWSDYTERYPNATEREDLPGRWDTRYAIQGGGNRDWYPMVDPYCIALIVDCGGPHTAMVDEDIQFNGEAFGGLSPYSWRWDFGDNTTSTEKNPVHNYSAVSTYTVTLTVTDGTGNSSSDTTTATIIEKLVADAQGPDKGFVADPVHFLGFASGGVPPYNWTWDFGDGNVSYGQSVNHIYSVPGSYPVLLTVTDSVGHSDNDAVNVSIFPKPLIVWVDDDYNEATPGWGYDHVNSIQDGIFNVVEGGNVVVASGVYHEHLVVNKALTMTGEDKNTTVIDGNGTGNVIYITKTNVMITNFTIQNSGIGETDAAIFVNTPNNVFRNNKIIISPGGGYGFYFSSELTLDNDIDMSNEINGKPIVFLSHVETPTVIEGLHLQYPQGTKATNYGLINLYKCKNISIQDCELGSNICGVYLYQSSQNTITKNIIKNNQGSGISLVAHYPFSEGRNTISHNLLIDNNNAIVVVISKRNIIVENTIKNNTQGVTLIADYNEVYHNNFINNTVHAQDFSLNGNSWDKGFPVGGNYWSRSVCNPCNEYGMSIEPYPIPPYGQDYHPLCNVFIPGDMNVDGQVNFADINPFIFALTQPLEYIRQYRIHPVLHGDINQDGVLDFGDINPFIALLCGS